MSAASKATLAATTVSAIAMILYVHRSQKVDQSAMHEGVLRDMESQRLRQERQLDFDVQKALEEEYRKVQTVDDGRGGKS
ncbi:hypothetical protein BT63DRAFT_426079 [Microthyrium microscopicum]|uniref:Cytochrome c oxidase assembly protein n=1 Tax=Microthyrium microscopicum TaxID=703497 RepID=A0A6A6UBV1_9PEZI|nr:hypothetical protein BT63DRAFT_426079 [Microthyrium microscopicum]